MRKYGRVLQLPYEEKRLSDRQFSSLYGVSKTICEKLYKSIQFYGNGVLSTDSLLMTLYFLKVYSTESVAAYTFGVTEKTFRKWVWDVLRVINKIPNVSSDNFFQI